MTDILKETQEAEREGKINAILSRAAVGIFLVGCMVVTYLGIHSWNINRDNEIMESDGVTLTQAINKINYNRTKNDTEDEKQKVSDINKVQFEKLEKLAEDNRSGYSALANIYLSSLALMDGNPSKALYYYQRVAKEKRFPLVIREYATLVEINSNLQFNKGVYETPIKQVKEYFKIDQDGDIDEKLLATRNFSNAMAITGIALENETGKNENFNVYLATLKSYEGGSENVNFIIDMVSQYMAQAKNEKK